MSTLNSSLPSSGKFKNGNPVTMGKIRPNSSNFYSNTNSNLMNGGFPSSESYRLMTPNLTNREAPAISSSSSAKIASSSGNSLFNNNLGDENLNSAKNLRAESATAMNRSQQSRSNAPNSIGNNGILNGYVVNSSVLPSTSGQYASYSESNNNNSTTLQSRAPTPYRTTRQNQQSSSLPAMNGNGNNSSNGLGNSSGLLFSSSQPISSLNNIFTVNNNNNISRNGLNSASNNNNNNNSSSVNQYQNQTYNYAYNSGNSAASYYSSNNNSSQITKNPFSRSQTAPAISNNAGNTTASAAANAANALILSVDGKRDWNIRDSITMPPIKHNISNDFTPSFNSLFRDEQQSKEDNDAVASTKSNYNQQQNTVPKSMHKNLKKVRFAEPIALFEPMTNTLRNRIINDVKTASLSTSNSNSNLGQELKSVLKVTSSPRPNTAENTGTNSNSGPSPINSTLVSINTMNNTLNNKSLAVNIMSKAMNQNMLVGRPISAPTGVKKLDTTLTALHAAATTQPNPILTSRDQIVKKSLLEIQNRIVSNLNSFPTDADIEAFERRTASSSGSKDRNDDHNTNEEEEEVSKKQGSGGQLEEKSNASDVLLSPPSLLSVHNGSSSSSNNSPLKQLDDVKRPKSASSGEFLGVNSMQSLFSPSSKTSSSSIDNVANNVCLIINNGNNSLASSNPATENALFNLMAKSILIGNFSCRVVNNIQFYNDRFEFLFPIIDFTSQSLFPNASNQNHNNNNYPTTGSAVPGISHFSASGNYSSLRSLTIYYKDVSNITLLSNKMRCRLAPNWYEVAAAGNTDLRGGDLDDSRQSSISSNIHGYLCIEFSSLSYMIIMREKIIPIISSCTKQ